MFNIDVSNMHWITDDDPHDLCAHGYVTVNIGDELFEFEGTVSATALRLLKTLSENHMVEDNGEQMIPCCGHFIIANDKLDNVIISGCDSGLDWTVLHQNDGIKLISPNQREEIVTLDAYKNIVFNFVDKVEGFYTSSKKKILPKDKFDRDGYIAFWNEWNIRRYGKKKRLNLKWIKFF